MAIFVGNRLVDNSGGVDGMRQVNRAGVRYWPDLAIQFTCANTITATPGNLQLTIWGSQPIKNIVISIKRGLNYISEVLHVYSFSVNFQAGDEVTILGPVDEMTIGSSILISSLTIQDHWEINKLWVENNTTLLEVHIDRCANLAQMGIRNGGNMNICTVDDNPALYALYLTGNKLTTLDLSTCKPLMGNVYINSNLLTWAGVTFPVTGFSGMLEISSNPLGTLDLTTITHLGRLRAQYCQIPLLDFSTVPQCRFLKVNGNNLPGLNVDNLPNLYRIECFTQYVPFTTLSLLLNPIFESIWCTYNDLSTLDFSANPLINSIEYYGNGVTDFLTTVVWPVTNKVSHCNLADHKLPSAQIDEILVNIDSAGLTDPGGPIPYECQIDGQVPAAPPTDGSVTGFDGITAKANLISRGYAVQTD